MDINLSIHKNFINHFLLTTLINFVLIYSIFMNSTFCIFHLYSKGANLTSLF